ncbi:kinase domain protein (macronuclear) [Tetrahymena thermophila SB210]|uniref:Kinase domain protein n=1 Tax=Tetrahymena thermophila (strain SB210) TaxID=312017 RepID=Q23CR5_TETTS|nr:kinase domain protein [Tetrahymena thermophila SB210]EAR94310.2 kinase domain protein [Tetrahymena thermophila SB210]|eukprot:XP_001014555.2 kinase domain protein [Tetrahymena thermophila SB210]
MINPSFNFYYKILFYRFQKLLFSYLFISINKYYFILFFISLNQVKIEPIINIYLQKNKVKLIILYQLLLNYFVSNQQNKFNFYAQRVNQKLFKSSCYFQLIIKKKESFIYNYFFSQQIFTIKLKKQRNQLKEKKEKKGKQKKIQLENKIYYSNQFKKYFFFYAKYYNYFLYQQLLLIMQQQQDIQLKYEAPAEKFEEIFEEYLQKHKKSMIFDSDELISIYNELQKEKIYLTSYISQGGFGCIFEAKHNEEIVAIKCSKTNFQKIEEEEKILNLLKDTPYVFKFIKGFTNQKKSRYYQISKRYSCNLKEIMKSFFDQRKTLPLNQIIGFAIQMSTVFEKIEQNKLLHSDIKPENILYDSQEKCFYLSDYGESKQFQNGSKTYDLKGYTPKYAAPEITDIQNGIFNIKYDIYGLGVILLELTLGKFLEDSDCSFIRNGSLPKYISKNALYQDINQIIVKMLEKMPSNRIGSFELTKKLNELRLKLENQFICAVQDKLDFTESNMMISKFRQSFLKFNYTCKQSEVRLDKYNFESYRNLSKIQECIAKRLVHDLNLNFSYNNLGADGAKNIGMSLEKCQNITSLNLNLQGNKLGADGAKNIGMSLEKCQNITSLNLNLCWNNLGADGAKNIGMSLEKCQNITSLNLNLSDNKLGADGAKNIGMSLEKCQNITSLNLNLSDNELGADGAKNIGMSLEKCQNITSLNLNLQDNKLGADGAKNIGMSLEKCQNITSLNLDLWQFNQLSIYLVCFNQYICEIETQNKWVWRIN